MPASHGWSPEALRNYEADKAEREVQQRIAAFQARAASIAERYSNDYSGYLSEYLELCRGDSDLASRVPAISEFLAEQEEEYHRLLFDQRG
ncbi:hypothetical protein [Sphingomonas sp. 3-13AW]|uniref:hypothetical protein n=1 Tax=Sphingomonas sp. 3-13AW TaxID=3050450 RepID=UPI003BB5539A